MGKGRTDNKVCQKINEIPGHKQEIKNTGTGRAVNLIHRIFTGRKHIKI